MNKPLKIITFSILALGVILIVASIFINNFLKNKVEEFLKDGLPENMESTYEGVTVGSISGSVSVAKLNISIENVENNAKHTFIALENLEILDLSYWDYLINNKISIDKITLENPKILYHKDRVSHKNDSLPKKEQKIKRAILIDRFQINEGELQVFDETKDSTNFYTKGIYSRIDGILIDQQTIANKIPFKYNSYIIEGDTLFVKANTFENLSVRNFRMEKKKSLFQDITFNTKYSKQELSKLIKKQRDHYTLSINSLALLNTDFGFKNKAFFAKSEEIVLTTPDFEIYRDKLLPKDNTYKNLYSKMLRELPFELTVDSLQIKKGSIRYEERVKVENMGGFIDFKNLNAHISNVSNTYKSPEKTHLKITANFMGNTPIDVDWNFDVQNPEDRFLFSAKVGKLNADRLNAFMEPNSNIKLQGNTNKTYFTIDGNNETSHTDLKINYTDFKVTILRKDGENKNKVLSAIANVFISKDSKKEGDNYKEGTGNATRNKTKSIFNFLWISIKSALKNAMI